MWEIKRTSQLENKGINALIYGKPGAGKTTLTATAPNPIILASESGLLSVKKYDLPYVEINTFADLEEALEHLKLDNEFETVCLDSITDIVETIILNEKKKARDNRLAYMEAADRATELIKRYIKELPTKNVIFIALEQTFTNSDGQTMHYPVLATKGFAEQCSKFFDEVLRMAVLADAEGAFRALQTASDNQYVCKDRSGELDFLEEPNLTKLIAKAKGLTKSQGTMPQEE